MEKIRNETPIRTTNRRLNRQGSIFFDSVTQLIPEGHEKPVKQALYTVATLAIFAIVCCVGITTFYILQIFLKPLFWAVLCGSFLFPLKYGLHKILDSWLSDSLEKGRPLLLTVSVLPLTLFNMLSEWSGRIFLQHWKFLACIFTGLLPIYILNHLNYLSWLFSCCIATLNLTWQFSMSVYTSIQNYNSAVLTLLIVYFATSIIIQAEILNKFSVVMWCVLFLYLLSNAGSFQIPIIILVLLLTVMGMFGKNKKEDDGAETAETNIPIQEINAQNNESRSSHVYFRILFGMLAIVLIWLHLWILLIILIPLTFWAFKMFISNEKTLHWCDLVIYKLFRRNMATIYRGLLETYNQRKSILYPNFVQKFVHIVMKGDSMILHGILSYLPMVTSVIIIVALFISSISTSMFLAVKIQQESTLVVKLTTNVINETVSRHPEYRTWLPDNGTIHSTVDSLVDTAYLQGRGYISNKLQATVGQTGNANKIEKQVLKMWDQMYHGWFTKKKQPPQKRLRRQTSFKGSNEVVNSLVDLLSMHEVIQWLQDNVKELMAIGETIMSVVQSNLALIMYFITSIFSAILNGGTFILNFVLSLVVFLTALFYVLSSSAEQYKPIVMVGSIVRPFFKEGLFEISMQNSLNGVFGASLRMFCFYGIYTWLNHSMFGSNLVYIPSVLAAIFAVVPILTTYWVCILSSLEIWLLQGNLPYAIGLIVFQILPTMFVDTAIYRDISQSGGAHPYITGLAVAGGVYTFGLEGAILGPLLWCFLLIAVDLYKNVIASGEHAIPRRRIH